MAHQFEVFQGFIWPIRLTLNSSPFFLSSLCSSLCLSLSSSSSFFSSGNIWKRISLCRRVGLHFSAPQCVGMSSILSAQRRVARVTMCTGFRTSLHRTLCRNERSKRCELITYAAHCNEVKPGGTVRTLLNMEKTFNVESCTDTVVAIGYGFGRNHSQSGEIAKEAGRNHGKDSQDVRVNAAETHFSSLKVYIKDLRSFLLLGVKPLCVLGKSANLSPVSSQAPRFLLFIMDTGLPVLQSLTLDSTCSSGQPQSHDPPASASEGLRL